MKRLSIGLLMTMSAMAVAVPTPFADPPKYAPNPVIPPPNATAIANSQPKPVVEYTYIPQLSQPMPPQLAVEQQSIVEKFRDTYIKQNKPHVLFFVGRESDKDISSASNDLQTQTLKDAFAAPFRNGGAVQTDKNVEIVLKLVMSENDSSVMIAKAVRLSDNKTIAQVGSKDVAAEAKPDPNAMPWMANQMAFALMRELNRTWNPDGK